MAGKNISVSWLPIKIIIASVAFINVFISVAFIYLVYFVVYAQKIYLTFEPGEKARYFHDTALWDFVTIITISFILIDLISTIIWIKGDLKARYILLGISIIHPIFELIIFSVINNGIDQFGISIIFFTIIINFLLYLAMKQKGEFV
jgi:hypothetical protein